MENCRDLSDTFRRSIRKRIRHARSPTSRRKEIRTRVRNRVYGPFRSLYGLSVEAIAMSVFALIDDGITTVMNSFVESPRLRDDDADVHVRARRHTCRGIIK